MPYVTESLWQEKLLKEGKQADEITALRERVRVLEAENEALRHWSWEHIDQLLLYVDTEFKRDSGVRDAAGYCRAIAPKKALKVRIDAEPLHPIRTTLKDQTDG